MNISPISNPINGQIFGEFRYIEDNKKSFETTLGNAMENKDVKKLKEACGQFESYFLHSLFKEMRNTIHSENGFLPKSHTENIFQEMLDMKVCENASTVGGIGIASKIFEQINREMGNSHNKFYPSR